MALSFWRKISVPKENLLALIERMDADTDGYITLGEVRDVLKTYGQAVRRSARFDRRR